MENSKVKRKSILIVCNILLTLLLLLTTAVTITLAIQQFNMNIGGNITFNATDVQATISAGQVANGTVADSANKMHEITITPENDGATEKATWENLEITFNGLDDVIISFTVTNNHTESNLKMSLTTSSINAENMTISTKIDNSSKTSVVIPKQAEGNDNKVDCQIIFHVESNLTSANIEGFSIEYTFANTDEEPTYAVAIDPSVSSMVTGVSLDSAEKGEQVTITANIQDTVTEDYVIMSDGLYYIENGSVEKVTINQIDGQYSFTMPANDITIGVEKYRRLDDFTFSGNAITGYTGSATELTLPSHYETVSINSQDYTVEKNTGTQITEIGYFAFQSYKHSTSITIPESVTSIDSYAFGNVANRVNIYYQGSLDQWLDIDIAFNDHAPGLSGDLYINNELVEEVTLDKNIQYTSFYGIMSLKEVILGENVTSIGDYAFQNCYSLAIVYNNSSLDITAGNPDNGYVGCYAYEVVNKGGTAQGRTQEINNVNYYINDSTQTKVALYAIDRTASEITLEEDTTAINVCAFNTCINLTKITIPANVTKLGAGAFYGCPNLTSITIPASVTEIGSSAFEGCYSLAIVYNNSSLNITAGSMSSNGNVGYYAYEIVNKGDTAQGRIEEIDNVSYYINGTTKVALSMIDRSASTVSLEEDTTTINQYAFDGCTNLTSITIPASVTTIGDNAFDGCTNLQTVDFGENSQLQTIGEQAFSGCTNLTSITIPASVTSIGDNAFSDCDSLQTVEFGKNSQLQTINQYAFDGCTNLSMITIPENVTSIIRYAFQNCTSLTSVTIESYDTYNGAIGTDGWSHCGGLLAYATTVKVLKTIVDGEGNVNDYLNNESNFTKTTQGADDIYYTYTKINNI